MKRISIFLLSVFIILSTGCAAVSTGAVPLFQVSSYEEKTISLKKGPVLNYEGDKATLELYTWDRNEMKFEITRRISGSGTRASLERRLSKLEVDVSEKSGKFYLGSHYNGRLQKGGDARADIRVYMPREPVRLEFAMDSGNIRLVDELKGIAVMRLDRVNVNINRFSGVLHVAANTGNIDLAGGYLYKGSRIHIKEGHILIKTVLDQSGEYSFETEAGNIELDLPGDSKFKLESIGSVEANDFEPASYPVLLKVKSGLGHILLRKY